MRKKELVELRKQLGAEFRLTGDVTGCDLLDWYTRAGRARSLREADTFEAAKASLRTAASTPFVLLGRQDRAVDAVLALLHGRGLDVSRARSRIEGASQRSQQVLQVFADDCRPRRTQFFGSDDGMGIKRSRAKAA